MLRPTLITLTLCLLVSFGFSQEKWSLERCINHALQNSLDIKQAQNSIRFAELTEKQNRFERLPSVNGSSSAGYQFGRTIDPFSNDFVTTSVGFNSYSINAGVTLFNGNAINNSIKQGRLDLEASKLEADAMSNNISLQVASVFLNILLSEEQLANAKQRLILSEEQLEQTDKLIRAGSIPENDRLDFMAQIARDKQTVIEAQNAVATNMLTLKQLLVIDPYDPIELESPAIDLNNLANPNNFELKTIYATALQTQFQIAAGDLRLQSAQLEERIAKAGTLPSLSLFGGLNTNFSSAAKDFDNPIPDNSDPIPVVSTVLINGAPVDVTFFQDPQPQFPDLGFADQMSQNFGQNFGLSLNVPIYNRHRNIINMERARLNVLNQEISNLQARNQLKTDVQRAIADATAAKESLEAATLAYEAAEAAYQNNKRRFDLGAINTLEFTTSRNQLDIAQIDLVRAKYQYLFNIKVVDFYEGKALRLY